MHTWHMQPTMAATLLESAPPLSGSRKPLAPDLQHGRYAWQNFINPAEQLMAGCNCRGGAMTDLLGVLRISSTRCHYQPRRKCHEWHACTLQLRTAASPLPLSPPQVVPKPAGGAAPNLLLGGVVEGLSRGGGQAEGVGRAAEAGRGGGREDEMGLGGIGLRRCIRPTAWTRCCWNDRHHSSSGR